MKASIAVALMIVGGAVPAAAQGVRPTPTIQVRVVDEQGTPVDAGRAVIDSLGRWVLVEKGLATITDLPTGTWTVSIRALGFRPEAIAVEASTQPTTNAPVVTMHRIPQNLAPVEVTGVLTSKDSAKLRDIERRMRVANGTLILSDNLSVRNANLAADALGAARGFTRKSETVVQGRNGCRSFPKSDSIDVRRQIRAGRQKVVAIYLDGSRLPGGLESINRMVPPSDILAIETYADVTSAPFIWRTDDACAVIAYWTKKPQPITVGR